MICSLLLQLNKEQMDFRPGPAGCTRTGTFVERPRPAVLPDAEPVVLDVYGSLLYAGATDSRAPGCPDPRGPTGRW